MREQNLPFQELLTGYQQRLLHYILSMIGDHDIAWDILQETNRVLLEKRGDYKAGTSFINWALTVAQFQTKAWLRDQKRNRLIVTPELVELMSEQAAAFEESDEQEREALEACVASLPAKQQALLRSRYDQSMKLSELSGRTGKSVNALKKIFFRLRGTLGECIKQRLAAV